MIICQVEARLAGMAVDEVEEELRLLREVLAALDGELIGAELYPGRQSLTAHVRVESELQASDVFDASRFAVDQIIHSGPAPARRLAA